MEMGNKMIKQRVVWNMNPVTRVVPSKKIYKRTKAKTDLRNQMSNFKR